MRLCCAAASPPQEKQTGSPGKNRRSATICQVWEPFQHRARSWERRHGSKPVYYPKNTRNDGHPVNSTGPEVDVHHPDDRQSTANSRRNFRYNKLDPEKILSRLTLEGPPPYEASKNRRSREGSFSTPYSRPERHLESPDKRESQRRSSLPTSAITSQHNNQLFGVVSASGRLLPAHGRGQLRSRGGGRRNNN